MLCDGSSIYLTFDLESEESLGKIAKYYTTRYGENSTAFMYIEGNWSIGKDGKKQLLNNVHIEGNQINEHNFIGMAKIDISQGENFPDSFDLGLCLNNVGADQVSDNSTKDSVLPSYYKKGTWNFSIPVKLDNSNVNMAAVNEVNKDGYGIISAVLTPYELKLKVSEKTAIDNQGVAVYTQDGERLSFEKQDGDTFIYAVQKKKVTSAEIFVCNDFIESEKCKNKSELEKLAILQKIINF